MKCCLVELLLTLKWHCPISCVIVVDLELQRNCCTAAVIPIKLKCELWPTQTPLPQFLFSVQEHFRAIDQLESKGLYLVRAGFTEEREY